MGVGKALGVIGVIRLLASYIIVYIGQGGEQSGSNECFFSLVYLLSNVIVS